MRSIRWTILFCFPLAFISAPSFAIGPVDVEVGLVYWFGEEKTTGEPAEDAEDLGGWIDLGVSRWHFALSQWRVSPPGGDTDFTALDVKYRVLAPSDGNFLALGIGGERVTAEGGGFKDDFTTARLIVEGGVSIKIVKLFGKYSYLPSLGDLDFGGDVLRGDKGQELEARVSLQFVPFFEIHGGYRLGDYDFDTTDGSSLSLETKGPFAGVGFRF